MRRIREEFYDSFKNIDDEYIEVFRNPSLKELRDVPSYPDFRFIIDNNGNAYVFDSDTLHEAVVNTIRQDGVRGYVIHKRIWADKGQKTIINNPWFNRTLKGSEVVSYSGTVKGRVGGSFKEIVGADVRCTNVALESFGICVPNPLMNFNDVWSELKKVYDVQYYARRGTYDHDTGKSVYTHMALSGNEEIKIPVLRLDHFVEYLKTMKWYGHFVAFIPGHAQAYHFIPGSRRVWAVDALRKFVSRSKMSFLIEVDGPYLDETFLNFLETTTRRNVVVTL